MVNPRPLTSPVCGGTQPEAVDSGSLQTSTTGKVEPFRLCYPVGSRKWNCRTAPNKRADLLGAFQDGQTVLARQVMYGGSSWLALTLPDGTIGWCKQNDEVHMVQHHNTRTEYGWYRVLYCSLSDEQTYGIALGTLTPELLQQLAASSHHAAAPLPSSSSSLPGSAESSVHAPGSSTPHVHIPASPSHCCSLACPPTCTATALPGPPPPPPLTQTNTPAPPSSITPTCCPLRRDRCATCLLPLRAGCLAYVGSCGHSYHFECLRGLGDANICTACGVWFAVGQSPPMTSAELLPTSPFQHVHQALWWVPPFYRYALIYGVMLLATPFLLIAQWLGLL